MTVADNIFRYIFASALKVMMECSFSNNQTDYTYSGKNTGRLSFKINVILTKYMAFLVIFVLLVLMLYVPVNSFRSCRDNFQASWVGPVLRPAEAKVSYSRTQHIASSES